MFTVTATAKQTIEGFGVDLACIPSAMSDAQADLLFSPSGAWITWCRLRASCVDGSIPGWMTIGANSNAGHVASALKARDRGARFWALADSNTIPSGWYSDQSLKIISPAKYANFAAGVAQIPAKGAELGLTVELVSIANEPDMSNEPKITGSVGHDLVAQTGPMCPVPLLLPETQNAGSVSAYADATLDDAATRTYIGRVATHVYGGTNVSSYAKAAAYGLSVWQSEYCQVGASADATMVSGLAVANAIHACLANLDHAMFGFFLVAGITPWAGSTYGLLGDDYALTKRFFTFSNYSRFIRPGFRRYVVSGAVTGVNVSAYTNADGRCVVVAVNSNTSDTPVQIQAPSAVASVTPWVTDATRNLAAQSPLSASGGLFSATLPAQSVTTFVAGPLTISASPVSSGATTVSITRAPGTTVTPSADHGTVGAITWDGDTGTCAVSALPPGPTTITATASDGESASVVVDGGAILPALAVSGSGSLGPVEFTVSKGLPLRDAASGRWCPLRYTANGKPLWIRRS